MVSSLLTELGDPSSMNVVTSPVSRFFKDVLCATWANVETRNKVHERELVTVLPPGCSIRDVACFPFQVRGSWSWQFPPS